jgi:hypothetical protein
MDDFEISAFEWVELMMKYKYGEKETEEEE